MIFSAPMRVGYILYAFNVLFFRHWSVSRMISPLTGKIIHQIRTTYVSDVQWYWRIIHTTYVSGAVWLNIPTLYKNFQLNYSDVSPLSESWSDLLDRVLNSPDCHITLSKPLSLLKILNICCITKHIKRSWWMLGSTLYICFKFLGIKFKSRMWF